ncbi:Tyrosine-protein phosphatase YVH1 [Cyberlindnera fabianii]|uniref:protein-tyrosine-phosphatase n=1 Tax=Cyberlindnera fabianii TaxID=36022 RepID=A0A1V2L707_CYBFA|nr:Tyrosine-protein phosphatase YVH1 [Cyberlindnera fabianii]
MSRVECEEANITHIVAVFKGQFPPSFNKYTMQTIPVDDLESTNIIEHFDDACNFINKALFPDESSVQRGVKRAHSTGVLIMCQAGVSRSVTVMAAYLMKKYNLTPQQALHAIKRKRPMSDPNESFIEQLELYHALGCQVNKNDPQYKQWLLSHAMLTDPTGASLLADDSMFADSKQDTNNEATSQLRCKRCRHELALSTAFVEHVQPGEDSKQSKFVRKVANSKQWGNSRIRRQIHVSKM